VPEQRPTNPGVRALAEQFARRHGERPPQPLTRDEVQEILSDAELILKIEQGWADLEAGRVVRWR
jgi:hypothetical protein